MIPAFIVFAYLAIVFYIGVFAFRKGKESGEDFFLAGRALGPYVFLLSLFGTNMTAFAILGSSGVAYQRGIGVYGLMASSSGIVIPLTMFFIGTRLWSLGKKFGHMTQVQYLRDRWECSGIGTFIFVLTAAMLLPYIIIGVMGGGQTLEAVSDGFVSYEIGGAIVAIVVMGYVFFGGMRGTAWVNTFQVTLFLIFGVTTFILISKSLGGYDQIMGQLGSNPQTAALLTRAKIPAEEFFSYMFIPLSAMMFPHVSIMCLTAEKVTHFKKTVIFYPLCIMAIWAPSVYLGVVGASQIPGLKPGESDDVIIRLLTSNTGPLIAGIMGAGIMACVMASDSQIMALSTMFTEDLFAFYGGKEKFGDKVQVWTGRAFVVAIGVIAYLIALTLKDNASIFELAIRFAFSGFASLAPIMLAALFWKRSTKWGALTASAWVAVAVLGTWWLHNYSEPIAPKPGPPKPPGAATAAPGQPPAMAAAPGAPRMPGQPAGQPPAAAPAPGTPNVAGQPSAAQPGKPPVAAAAPGQPAAGQPPTPATPGQPTVGQPPAVQPGTPSPVNVPGGPAGGPPKPPQPVQIFPALGDMFLRGPTNVTIYGYLPVMPMVLISALLMVVVSLMTKPPSQKTLDKYFPQAGG